MILTGKAVDMWSLGVILFVLLGGYLPFDVAGNVERSNRRIMLGAFNFHEEFWSGVSEVAKDLIRLLLVVDPTDRLTVDAALAHAWVRHMHGWFIFIISPTISRMFQGMLA